MSCPGWKYVGRVVPLWTSARLPGYRGWLTQYLHTPLHIFIYRTAGSRHRTLSGGTYARYGVEPADGNRDTDADDNGLAYYACVCGGRRSVGGL